MRRTILLFVCLSLLKGLSALQGAQPSRWMVATQEEFLKGDLDGVSATSDGRLLLAPSLEQRLDTEQAFCYSAVLDRGNTLYVGTGNEGKIFRLGPRGESSLFAQLEESGVYALAVDSMDRLYAGTSPDGQVYRLDAQGQAQVFFDPDDKYIWALTFDRNNNLFVATGPKGIIYRVSPEGHSQVFFDSQETHLVSLAWDRDGNLLAGGAPAGLIFRISPQGTATVLYDSPLEEIKALTVDRYGFVYAAALGKVSPARGETPASGDQETDQQEGVTVRRPQVAAGGKSLEIYRIDPDNGVNVLYTSNEEVAFDLLVRSDGSLLVGTGNRGRILLIDSRRYVTILNQSQEEQVTRLLEQSNRIFVVTSNLGKVYELLPQPSRPGTYLSQVLDAGAFSSWGRIAWQVLQPAGSAPLRLYTRSGNTSEPDQTWSDWSPPYQDPRNSRIESPPGRYLQFRVEFPAGGRTAAVLSENNALDMVSINYLQRNLAPELTSLTVHPQGVAFTRFPSGNATGGVLPGGPDQAHLRSLPPELRELARPQVSPPPRKIFQPGARSLSWSARDPNDDDLLFQIYYRRQEETTWKLLKEDWEETHYTLDGLSFPDGLYLVKVVATDRPSNPPEMALESELVSKPFVISNTSPRVELDPPVVEGRNVRVSFRVAAHISSVFQAEYSVNGGAWVILFPKDGIADSEREEYEFSRELPQSGEYSFTVRVVDTVGNVGSGTLLVQIP